MTLLYPGRDCFTIWMYENVGVCKNICYVVFSFVSGPVSCKEILSVCILRNIGWSSVCFLRCCLRSGSSVNKLLLFFAFFMGICTHVCCTAAPSGPQLWARHKILVDHSVCFHTPFNLGGNHDGDAHWLFILVFELCFCACCFSHVVFWHLCIFAQNS